MSIQSITESEDFKKFMQLRKQIPEEGALIKVKGHLVENPRLLLIAEVGERLDRLFEPYGLTLHQFLEVEEGL